MTGSPAQPKIYHIVHVDKLRSIASGGGLWCDAEILERENVGTTIGMADIKQRRLGLPLSSHRDLMVGDCVPFYFCYRSVMLYLIYKANHPNLTYRGGQEPIVHLQIDLKTATKWADRQGQRWAFTLSNAGARYFEDRHGLDRLDELNWKAIDAATWAGGHSEGKQAEFLIEKNVPWELVERIGVYSQDVETKVGRALHDLKHRPIVEVQPAWYY